MAEEIVSLNSEESDPPKVESSRDDWRPYHGDLIAKLLLEKVRDATATQSMMKLEESIQACEQHNLGQHKEVVKGKEKLHIITVRHSLREALREAKVYSIRRGIQKIQEDPTLRKELQQDVIEAEQFISELERRNRVSEKILVLNRKTMSEIRRYCKPSISMKKVIQAALLLMGFEEDKTNEWGTCLRLLNPQGKAGMGKRILDFNPDSVDPRISARAKLILTTPYHADTGEELSETKINNMSREEREKYVKHMDLTSVRQASPAAAAFYVWSMGVIDQTEATHGTEAKPATKREQKLILRKPDLTPQGSEVSPIMKRKYVSSNGAFLERDPEY